jgi:hypothetical protein
MANNFSNTKNYSLADRLDTINMSGEERNLAKNQLRSIERTLDALWDVSAWFRTAFAARPVAQPRKRAAA